MGVNIREEFEQWASENLKYGLWVDSTNKSGQYTVPEIETAWQAWQAARESEGGEAVYLYRAPGSDPNNWREIPKATYDIHHQDDFFKHHKYRIFYERNADPHLDNWIPVNEKCPTERDGDYNEDVWVYDRGLRKAVMTMWADVEMVLEYTHWMPTGLTRPAPPEQESE